MNKLLFASLILAISLCGCGGSDDSAANLELDASPDVINCTDASFNDSDSSEDIFMDISSDTADCAIDIEDTLLDSSKEVLDADIVETSGCMSNCSPTIVNLHSASNYVMLAKSAISTVPKSYIVGNVGLSPAAASYITGFSMIRAGTYWTSSQVIGELFAANNDPPTPSLLTVAILDMQEAYVDAATRPTPDFLNFNAGELGGQTLKPGLYKFGTNVLITTDATFDGDENSIWIMQISGNLTEANAKHVFLTGGAVPEHIFWQIAGFTSIGTTSHLEGVVLCKTKIVMKTGSSVNGDLFSQTAINLDSTTVIKP